MYESISFPGHELSPLHKLAQRLFSICANSASCERLFSRFGLILTRLRSRLGLKNLLNIAELSLHLRDEYSQSDKAASDRLRRKRKIIPNPPATNPPSVTNTNQPIPPDTANSEELPSSDQETQISSTSNTENEDLESFTGIIDMLGQQSDADQDDDSDDFTSPFEKEPLCSLFNFQDKTWVEMTERISLRSLDEELELYELIELDAEGEDDEQEFDGMMSSTI